MPIEDVRRVAPRTLMWIVEGTRRSAALAGVNPATEDYATWSILRMADSAEILLRHGIQHIFTPILSPSHFAEVTPKYRERLIDWVGMYVSHPEIVRAYVGLNCRLRLIGSHKLPELAPIAERLKAMGPADAKQTLWIMVIPSTDTLWEDVFSAMASSRATTKEELITACFGEPIPPADMLISFGKPVLSLDQIPPLLVGKMNCYWMQRPGYRLTEEILRTILYDAAYVRRTWREDKTGRAEQSIENRRAWEEGPTLGLGVRVGPFWYPAPLAIPKGTEVDRL